ncbi:hypothetical protein [Gloeocapsopsis dulcis]|nr:hypothetical protein [Gloeocapsopsis dulcis]WNN91041.1 hypothetical protein P0S91_08175 [Gloeocapsopsis dulcis]
MAYSTAELIQILANERQACLKGERLKIAATASGNPIVDRFIKSDGIQKFDAYQDFKAAVHCYQQEYGVSGIVWRQLTLKGKSISYPEIDSQLIALPQDLEILKLAKESIVSFWHEVTIEMDLYRSVTHGKDYRLTTLDQVNKIAQRMEWANLCKWEKANFLEILLQLGWGQPESAAYNRELPIAGSEYIHAVNPGQRPIC